MALEETRMVVLGMVFSPTELPGDGAAIDEAAIILPKAE